MHSVTREFSFEAAHRILGHSGRCKHIHGHSYRALVEVVGEPDALGMVIDFADLKATVGQWVKDNWDHNLILQRTDPLAVVAAHDPVHEGILLFGKDGRDATLDKDALFAGRPPFLLDAPPTAEALSRYLYDEAKLLLDGRRLAVVMVTVWEQADASASYSEDPAA